MSEEMSSMDLTQLNQQTRKSTYGSNLKNWLIGTPMTTDGFMNDKNCTKKKYKYK